MRIVNQVSSSSNSKQPTALKEKIDQTTKQFNEKINEKKVKHAALMDHVKKELAKLKKEHGPDRAFLKSDPFYPDFLRAQELAEEVKVLKTEKQKALEELKKQVAASIVSKGNF